MKEIILILLFALSSVVSATTYYVAPPTATPAGKDSNPGTITQPWGTWQKAFETAVAGDIVYFRGGVWYPTTHAVSMSITKIAPNEGHGHNGTYANPICYFNYPGETPVLDCKYIKSPGAFSTGLSISYGNFLKFRGLEIRNVYQVHTYCEVFGVGATDCSNLTFENMKVHHISGNAFRYQGAFGYYGITTDSTRFINCDAYHCCDSLIRDAIGAIGGAADGFKVWNEPVPGPYFLFDGCRAWNCSDDGFDDGSTTNVIHRNCWSWNNGYLDGDGSGFKISGITDPDTPNDNVNFVSRVVSNCIAAYNRWDGFYFLEYEGYHRAIGHIYNNIAYKNKYGYTLDRNSIYPTVLHQFRNNITYQNNTLDISEAYLTYNENHNTWDDVPAYPGYVLTDTVTVTNADFLSVDSTGLSGPRQADGSLPYLNFLRLAPTSDLIDAGTRVGLPYSGSAPDIGAFESTGTNPNIKLVTSITVTGAGGATTIITDNGTLQLSATVLPSDAINKSVTWSISSGTDKGSISSTGLVTAFNNGVVIARATARDGSGVFGSLQITITNQVIPVTSISLAGAGGVSTISMDNGTLQLSATVLPANSTNSTVTWSITSGTDKALISSTGLVTALDNGTVVARATANDGSGIYGILTITISNQGIPVTGITVTGAGGATTINVDNGTLQLNAAVLPANATNRTVTWSISSGTDKASISSTGFVTALDNGTAIARATANDGSGVYGTLTISISNQVNPVTSISVSGEGGRSLISLIGGTLQLSASVLPANATTKTVTWSITSGTDKASISPTGLVTAIANGTSVVRAIANDGSGVFGTFTITISNQVIPVSSITVTGAEGATSITADNGTLQLNASVLPANASNKTVTWSISEGADKASVSSTGIVAALENGTITAKATAIDGSGTFGLMTITISNQLIRVTSITVTGTGGSTTISTDNGTLQLSALIMPSNATNNTVTWSITSGSDKASINSTGLVTALDNGTATIRATANDGSGIFGSLVITLTNQVNENLNTPPVIVVDYKSNSYSGFVNEINASGSYDSNKDNLTFSWIIPNNVPVSSTTNSIIKYLGPSVNSKQTYLFTLNVNDGKTTTSKVIPVDIVPYRPDLEVAEINDIEASDFEAPYFPYNVADGNIGTMWSAYGDNQWLIIELKRSFSIHHVKLAFQSGQRRESYFDILGSSDSITWEPIMDKTASCDFSGDLQVFEFPASKTAREYNYIKLVGHGNFTDAWNFISELKVFGYRHKNSPMYEKLPVKVYPNPARESVTVRLDDSSLIPDFFQITKLSGTVVMSGEIDPGLRQFSIPINLKKGIYILQLSSDNITLFTQKLVVSR
jgi:uncharacterized protein YjdB